MPPAGLSGIMGLTPGSARFMLPTEGLRGDPFGLGTADADVFQQTIIERPDGPPLTLMLGIGFQLHHDASEEPKPRGVLCAPCLMVRPGFEFELMWLHQHGITLSKH